MSLNYPNYGEIYERPLPVPQTTAKFTNVPFPFPEIYERPLPVPIARVQEPDFGRGGDIDATASQPSGDGRMAVLIEVEANRTSHWPSVL